MKKRINTFLLGIAMAFTVSAQVQYVNPII